MDRRPHGRLSEIDVRTGAYRQIQLRPIAVEENRSRPVATAKFLERDDLLARPRDAHGFGIVGEALDGRRSGDVHPVVVHGKAVRSIEPFDKRRLLAVFQQVHRTCCRIARSAVGQQELVARTQKHEARPYEARHVLLDRKARRHLQPRIRRFRNDLGIVAN